LQPDFIMPLQTNRKLALSGEAKRQGGDGRVDSLEIEAKTVMTSELQGLDFPLPLVKPGFTNADGSLGMLYLITSHRALTDDEITPIYQPRWNVETEPQSLKPNASLSQSPTQTVTTPSHPFLAALCAFIKLQVLKVTTTTNHCAWKSKLYRQPLQTAFQTLHQLLPVRLTA
jgi:hypothetical protein